MVLSMEFEVWIQLGIGSWDLGIGPVAIWATDPDDPVWSNYSANL